MPCANCGGFVALEDHEGSTDGPFTEYYECAACGRRGHISGDAADSPRNWRKSGVCRTEGY